MRFSRHRRFILTLGVALLVWGSVGNLQASTFHVSPFGSNTPPYDSYAKAAHELGDALLTASGHGDTVLIHTGVYGTDTTLNVPEGVTLAGVGRDSVTLNWDNTEYETGILAEAGGRNEVFGIEFNYPMGSAFNINVIAVFAPNPDTVIFRDCRFRHLMVQAAGDGDFVEVFGNEFYFGSGYGVYIGGLKARIYQNRFSGASLHAGIYCSLAASVLIESNTFDTDATRNGYIGIGLSDCWTITARNNLFLNCSQPVSWYYGSGSFENNTVIRAVNGGAVMDIFLEPYQTVTIRNNIIQDNLSIPLFSNACSTCDTTGLITYVHNAFWPPIDSFYNIPSWSLPWKVKVLDSANFNAFPMFARESGCGIVDSSFRLQSGSPLIDAGDPAVLDANDTRSDLGWWGGPQGSSYVYLDQPPAPPESLSFSASYPEVMLWWHSNHETDLIRYDIHRADHPGIVPTVENQVTSVFPPDSTFTDTLGDSLLNVYYVVVARDASEQGCASNEVTVSPTGIFDDDNQATALPRTPQIVRTYPNPFNAATTLDIVIPDRGLMPAPVRIMLYDVTGVLAAIAYEGYLNAGQSSIRITATSANGSSLASGVYFARLKVWNTEFGPTRKLVLVK